MKIRIYHELNGTVRIVKVVEQGPEKGKESSMFHNLKPGSMAEVEIDAVLQHQACMKESKSESKEKDDSCNLQKFLQVYAPDMPYITVKKTASKMKISVEDAEKIIDSYQKHLKPIAYELVFDNDEKETLRLIQKVRDSGARLFVNSLWPKLCGGHDDDRAVELHQPDESWGWIIAQGAKLIQTDRPALLLEYLRNKKLHD